MRSLVVVLAALLVATAARAAPSDELAALFSDYWATTLSEDPFQATQAGVADYNRLVPAVAPADHRRRKAIAGEFAKRLEAIALDGVSETERVSADILRFILKHELALAEFDAWRQPFLSDSGFHTAMNKVSRSTPFRTRADYEDYVARLEALPAFLDQNVANMRQGLDDGFTQPREILPHVLPSFEAQTMGVATEHPLYVPFAQIPDSIPPVDRARLERDGARVLQEKVIPAFERVFAFMKDEYVPRARASLGVSSVTDGEEVPPGLSTLVAKLVTYGRSRTEALSRMERALLDMRLVIKKGTSNRSFLLALISRPEVRAGPVDIDWLDGAAEGPELQTTPHSEVALLAAAAEGHEQQMVREREAFLKAAGRGRP